LTIIWGNPSATLHSTVSPRVASNGEPVTYTLGVLGSGQAMTLTDDLPAHHIYRPATIDVVSLSIVAAA